MEDGAKLIRPVVDAISPYTPGRPIEEVQRELGLTRVVKLASNEGPFPPLPAALEAIDRSAADLNRYPDGANTLLEQALAVRHGVTTAQICAGSGADGCLDILSQAVLDPGDEIVCGWPSFPSYAIYAAKQAAVATRVALSGGRYDLDALADAVSPRTKLVYVCHPNNPTGTMNTAAELDALLDRLPDHVLAVIDQAYFEYVDAPDYPDAVERYLRRGRRVLVLRTFSKIYGLAGLRVGYAVGPPEVCRAMRKLRRPFDLTRSAQEAALASLDDATEIERRASVTRAGRARLEQILRDHGLPAAPGAVANFVYVETGAPAAELADRLLAEGVIVRPLGGFGASHAIRVTVGTDEELDIFAAALGRALAVP